MAGFTPPERLPPRASARSRPRGPWPLVKWSPVSRCVPCPVPAGAGLTHSHSGQGLRPGGLSDCRRAPVTVNDFLARPVCSGTWAQGVGTENCREPAAHVYPRGLWSWRGVVPAGPAGREQEGRRAAVCTAQRLSPAQGKEGAAIGQRQPWLPTPKRPRDLTPLASPSSVVGNSCPPSV